MSLARFNSVWTLVFLVASLHALTTFLYSSQDLPLCQKDREERKGKEGGIALCKQITYSKAFLLSGDMVFGPSDQE